MCHVIMAKSRRIAKMYNQIEMSVRITNVLSWTFLWHYRFVLYTVLHWKRTHSSDVRVYINTCLPTSLWTEILIALPNPHTYTQKSTLPRTYKQTIGHLFLWLYGCTYTNVKCNESTKGLKVCKRVTVRFSQKRVVCMSVCVYVNVCGWVL